ncbi:hypothetical protein SAMN05421820_101226 [Pedobacter steynii]|uniref:Uncharacterized protein n=1 Tax=Pedobacter steynii TaxID=430522 RepID=A0A1G9JCN4_9SPHI|nr:hypothetical protein SAMN05421820_101226 [Pedobacter steynii]
MVNIGNNMITSAVCMRQIEGGNTTGLKQKTQLSEEKCAIKR